MDLFSFFKCFHCGQPYFGGRRQCENQVDSTTFDPRELVCAGCSGAAKCSVHGQDFIHFKCRFCCSIASWFCFGRVHYCEKCHSVPYEFWDYSNVLKSIPPQCKGKSECALGIEHPPNGFEEYALGCSVCELEKQTCTKLEDIHFLKNSHEDYDNDDIVY